MTGVWSRSLHDENLLGARLCRKQCDECTGHGQHPCPLRTVGSGFQSLPALSQPICLDQSHLTLMTWIFSILRVAASLVCTKTVKVQPEEARV